jgi:hypothetical protein
MQRVRWPRWLRNSTHFNQIYRAFTSSFAATLPKAYRLGTLRLFDISENEHLKMVQELRTISQGNVISLRSQSMDVRYFRGLLMIYWKF